MKGNKLPTAEEGALGAIPLDEVVVPENRVIITKLTNSERYYHYKGRYKATRKAWEDGVKKIVLPPHEYVKMYCCRDCLRHYEKIRTRIRRAKRKLSDSGVFGGVSVPTLQRGNSEK